MERLPLASRHLEGMGNMILVGFGIWNKEWGVAQIRKKEKLGTGSESCRLETVSKYIERQEEHHRKQSFIDELKELLGKHGIQYDPKYLL